MRNLIIFGIGAAAGALIVYNLRQRENKAPVYVSDLVTGDYNARTIPPFGIFVSKAQAGNTALLDHERRHWQQYQEMGLVDFYITYAGQMKQYGYDNMPMEKEVRAGESEYCRQNYTECVRSGQARTVHNPDFRS